MQGIRDIQDVVLGDRAGGAGPELVEDVRPLQEQLLETLLGPGHQFPLVELVDLGNLVLGEVLEALPAQEEDFQLAQGFARSHAAHLLQHALEILTESGMAEDFFFLIPQIILIIKIQSQGRVLILIRVLFQIISGFS